MALTLKCTCGEVMKVGEEHAGKIGKCPHCGKPNKIPTLDEIQEFRKKSARLTKEDVAGKQAAADGEKQSAPAESPESKAPASEPAKKDSKKFKIPSKSSKFFKKDKDKEKGEEDKKTPSGRIKTASGRLKTKSGRIIKGRDEDEEGTGIRGRKQKRNPLVVFAVIGGVALVFGIVAIFAFSSPDYKGAKKLYGTFCEIARKNIGDPLFNTCFDLSENTAGLNYTDLSKANEDMRLAWGNFRKEINSRCPGAKASSAYKMLEQAYNAFIDNVWEKRAKGLQLDKYERDPDLKINLLREIRKELIRIQGLVQIAHLKIMAGRLDELSELAGEPAEEKKK
jgi:hypothetical protein